MSATEAQLSLNDWAVLAIVSEGERHGFAVARELCDDGELGRVWTVPRPLVYRSIKHLGDVGYVEPLRTEAGDQGPRRTVVRATRRGRAHLRRWLETPVVHLRDVRSELLLKLTVLDRRGDSLAGLAERQLDSFQPAFDGLAAQVEHREGTAGIVNLWRFESSRSVERTLREIVRREHDRGA